MIVRETKTEEVQHNWVARLTGFFIRNKQLAIMMLVLLLILGTVSLFGLRREGFPEVPVKVAVIQTIYKGAGPAEIERSITAPIENSLKGNKNIKEISSQTNDSSSTVIATIEPSADLDGVIQEINSKVSNVELPKDADKPTVFQPSTGGASFVYSLSGEMPLEKLLEEGRQFEDQLSEVKGVQEVKPDVEVESKVKIEFDPVKLAAAGVDVSQLTSAIAAGNINLPAGTVTTGDATQGVLFTGRYDSISKLGEVRLPSASGGTGPRLADVATITVVQDDGDKISRVGVKAKDGKLAGQTGLVYNISIRDDADILEVEKRIKDAATDFLADSGQKEKLLVELQLNQAQSTRDQIHEITAGAVGEKWEKLGVWGWAGIFFGGIWLLAIAMAIFVNIRAAFIAVLAIPLSFMVTLTVLYFGGVTLNTLTLFSMILALSLIVDPVIVVLEALQRYKDRGYQGVDAALRAVDSIGIGVFMAVVLATVVFIPFGIVSGVFGEIIRYIPITVIPSLVASFFVPIIFLTSIGVRVLKAKKATGGQPLAEEETLWRFSKWLQRTNRGILNKVWAQILIILVALVLPIATAAYFFGSGKIQSVQFSTPNDTEAIQVSVSYPASYSPEKVDELAQKAEASLNTQEDILHYYYFLQDKGSFTIYAELTKPAEREPTATDIINSIQPKLPSEEGKVYAKADILSAGPPSPEFPVQLQVYEGDQQKLKSFVDEAEKYLKSVDGVSRVVTDYNQNTSKQITINPKPEFTGQAATALGGQIAGLLQPQPVTKLQTATGEQEVEAVFGNSSKPTSEAEIRALSINGPTGATTVGAIASVRTEQSTGSIARFNGQRFATVQAAVDDTQKQFQIQADLQQWAKDNAERFGLKDTAFESKGEGDEIAKSFSELFLALGVSIILVYAIQVVFFRSFLQPLIITFAVPLSFIGVFPAVYFFGGGQFGFLEILGMITLVGIVTNVGIFVIDYANRRVAEGMAPKEAIALATAVRFRPVFLTKVVAFASLLPLAIISPFWRGLASVIVSGILISGIASLFTTPILYVWFEKLGRLPRRIFRRGRGKQDLSGTTPIAKAAKRHTVL